MKIHALDQIGDNHRKEEVCVAYCGYKGTDPLRFDYFHDSTHTTCKRCQNTIRYKNDVEMGIREKE